MKWCTPVAFIKGKLEFFQPLHCILMRDFASIAADFDDEEEKSESEDDDEDEDDYNPEDDDDTPKKRSGRQQERRQPARKGNASNSVQLCPPVCCMKESLHVSLVVLWWMSQVKGRPSRGSPAAKKKPAKAKKSSDSEDKSEEVKST